MRRRSLVIGLGSIGTRHARLLRQRGDEVAVVSRRGGDGVYADLAEALAATAPDLAVIATETAHHGDAIDRLAALRFRGTVLVEKPLFAAPRDLPAHDFADLLIAYNLRGHPGIRQLRTLLAGERLLSAQIYVGQYLPDWRPGRDYATTYSCSASQGGGALRDLSHELDYANWLLGPWRRVAALGGKLGSLAGDSDDGFVLLAEFARCPATSIHVNYLDRQTRREIVVNSDAHTFSLDFISGQIKCDRDVVARHTLPADATYLALHDAVLAGETAGLCGAVQGQRVVAMIAAAEQAARSGAWVSACREEEDAT